jgi:ornithine lipid hydroxylase
MTLRRLAQWSAFPMILGGVLALAMLLMRWVEPLLATALAEACGAVALIAAERLLPYREPWLRSHGDVRTDMAHAAVSGIATAYLARPLVQLAAGALAAWLAARVGGTLWPTAWPTLAQLALALVIAELPQYWLHRWEHERDALWRFHAVHHSVPRLYWLNAGRFHPVDLLALYVVGYVPLVLLGTPEQVILLFALFDAVFGMLQHSNVDVRLGPLNRVFSMAEPHRWHHSRVLAEANANYGSNLTIWDVAFGTFLLPSDRLPPADIGIAAMPAFPTGYFAQLAVPFRWTAAQRDAARQPL